MPVLEPNEQQIPAFPKRLVSGSPPAYYGPVSVRPVRSFSAPKAPVPKAQSYDIDVERIRKQERDRVEVEAIQYLQSVQNAVVRENKVQLEEFEAHVSKSSRFEAGVSEEALVRKQDELIEAERQRLQKLAEDLVANAKRDFEQSANERILYFEQQILQSKQDNERLKLETAEQLRQHQHRLEQAEL